jgi:hypothetical protein
MRREFCNPPGLPREMRELPSKPSCDLKTGRYIVRLDWVFEMPALLRFKIVSGPHKWCMFDVEPYTDDLVFAWVKPLYEAAFGVPFKPRKDAIKRALRALHRYAFSIDVVLFLNYRHYPVAEWATVCSLKDHKRRNRTGWDFECEPDEF